MAAIEEIKQREITDTPVLLFECLLPGGAMERWSTHGVVFEGSAFKARILRHDVFDIRALAEDGVDGIAKVSVTLANADSYFSQIEQGGGFKGAKITVRFAFFDLSTGESTSNAQVVFRGLANPPDEITESTMRLTFANRLNLQRMLMPQVRIQRRCPWVFPKTTEQRVEALSGLTKGKYSSFFRCGYSPDVEGGVGTLNAGVPFTSCDYTKIQCQERGMFSTDSAGHITRRFGGVEFVPSSTLVKSYGEKSTHQGNLAGNEAKYNDFVPLVYGTAWYRPAIVFARNDGNLTHLEVLLGMGDMKSVLKVIANGVEIPAGRSGANMTGTGWFNVVSLGNKTGSFNLDFVQSNGQPAGDPYGSMALMSLVLPNRISDGSSLPKIDVLVEGIRLSIFDASGGYVGESFSNNPAWILLDVLRRAGWTIEEVDVPSFAATAAYCDEVIETEDLNGNPQQIARFQCNYVLSKRRSAADLIRGIRMGSGLYLGYGSDGALTLRPESSLAIQQPTKSAGSNSTDTLNGGWPAYEFGDGTHGFTDVLRRASGEAAVRLWSRSTSDTPNRYTVEFQDEFNEFQQDSLSLVDFEDTLAVGQEISASLTALGLPNFNQAARIIRLQLNRAIRGNRFLEFETGLRSVGLKPGDLITFTYLKEGLDRQLFRVTRISPSLNYRSSRITAQIHDDSWYSGGDHGELGVIGGGREPGYEVGTPRPLSGSTLDAHGFPQFGIEEQVEADSGGQYEVAIAASYAVPRAPSLFGPGVPYLSLAAELSETGGSLAGGENYYYSVSGVDANGNEGLPSFVVRATTPEGSSACQVTLRELSFSPGSTSFHVYRGANPMQMLRIASDQPIATTFVDAGLTPDSLAPLDKNFHHANFYWRLELIPEHPATSFSAVTIGNSSLEILNNELVGKTVRITGGRGMGQERNIEAHTSNLLTVNPKWDIEPDNTSTFVVSESSWQFGAVGQTSPVVFSIPNRQNSIVQVTGRSANVHDKECSAELSPLTRHVIGGSGLGSDGNVPPEPIFGLSSSGQGMLELAGIGFSDLANTATIRAASFTVHYVDETAGPTSLLLASDIDETTTTVTLSSAGSAQEGSVLEIGGETVMVVSVSNGGLNYEVERGAFGSTAASHATSTPILHLLQKLFVLPFVENFFGTRASGSYSFPISMPDVRVVAAEMYVTNRIGNSPIGRASYGTIHQGIRTLSGGQLSLQIEGFLAIQTDAVPAITMDASHAVRDIVARVKDAPTGGPIQLRLKLDGVAYCELTIPMGEAMSNIVDGAALSAIPANAQLGLDVISVSQTGDSTPGRDLTVTVRF